MSAPPFIQREGQNPMSFLPTQEQTMLRDSARSFLSEQAPVAQLRALRTQTDGDGFDRALWQRFAALGFTGMLVPEAHGGLGLGHTDAGLLMQEIGRHLSVLPFCASAVVAASAIRVAGSEAQRAALLPAIASGERIAALAVDERSRHDPEHIALTARRDGEGWVLNGSKTFVEFGHAADLLIVAARSGDAPSDTALFAVPRATPGLQAERVAMVDTQASARLQLQDLHLGADALLGAPEQGGLALQAALDAGRAAAAAELLGIADEVFARTLAYLKERQQFGRAIGEFQALQHRAAALMVDIELARAAVGQASQALDADPARASAAVSVAKSRAGRSATLAVQEGVQMHGGMGMTDEFEMGFFMKRVRVLQERYGDAGFHADRLARLGGY